MKFLSILGEHLCVRRISSFDRVDMQRLAPGEPDLRHGLQDLDSLFPLFSELPLGALVVCVWMWWYIWMCEVVKSSA